MTVINLALADTLRDRYVLERELGRGGMATVYLARDLRHDRLVALKVVQAGLASRLTSERFLREIRTAARLQHPHILTVFESGEAAGQLWFTMPYVEGETLGERLRREGQLSLTAALRITQEVAQALQYAHEHGVVHRDVKPGNLLLTPDGNTLVADFGIAWTSVRGADESSLTETGLALGTPAYMSPEQATGSRDIDGRADIYALSCVLYEMLAGEPPFTGPTALAIIAKRCVLPVPSVRVVRPSVPEAVDRVIQRGLAEVPSDRFASAAEFIAALDEAATDHARADLISHAVPASPAIAVLPFVNLSPEKEAEYFSDGMTDELTTALARVPGLRVASRSSAFAFKGKEFDARTIGQRLRVDSLVEGSVRKVGNRIRLTAQLVDVKSGFQRWSESYERTIADVFALQEELSQAIVAALPLRSGPELDITLVKPATVSLEAYTLYLRGRYYANKRTMAGHQVATEYFEQAVERDPEYALAYAGLADCWTLRGFEEWGDLPPHEAMPKAKAAALKAIELNPGLADAHAWLGVVRMLYDWDWVRAETAFERAVKSSPPNSMAHLWYALFLGAVGRHEESISRVLRAQAVDPASLPVHQSVARCYVFAGEYDRALEQLGAAVEMDPNHPLAYAWMARAYFGKGALREALEQAERGMKTAGQLPLLLALAGRAYGELGMRSRALELLEQLPKDSERNYVSPMFRAMIAGSIGELDEAFRLYDLAFEQRAGYLAFKRVSRHYDYPVAIRSDPRFMELLKKLRLNN